MSRSVEKESEETDTRDPEDKYNTKPDRRRLCSLVKTAVDKDHNGAHSLLKVKYRDEVGHCGVLGAKFRTSGAFSRADSAHIAFFKHPYD